MADQVLTLNYSTTTGRVTISGLTGPLTNATRAVLTQLGVSFKHDENVGRLIDKGKWSGASRRAALITKFNSIHDQDPNPFHATDNLTVVMTSV